MSESTDVRGEAMFGQIIEEFEKQGNSALVKKWARRFCKENKYHYGAYSREGDIAGTHYKERFACWNCNFLIERTTVDLSKNNERDVNK